MQPYASKKRCCQEQGGSFEYVDSKATGEYLRMYLTENVDEVSMLLASAAFFAWLLNERLRLKVFTAKNTYTTTYGSLFLTWDEK